MRTKKHKDRQIKLSVQLGALVRLRRQELKMSQEELGAAIGVSFQQVQKYERGSNRISIPMLFFIAETLGVTPQYFIDQMIEAGENKPAAFEEFVNTHDAAILMRFWLRIAPSARVGIRKLMEELANDGADDEVKA